MSKATKKLFIKTFGCQMNVYDSERMSEALEQAGYESIDAPETADLVILNTCHIREKAAEKIYSELGRLRQIKTARKSAGQDTMIAVTGCVAQAEGKEILKRAPMVDLVVGPQSYHRLGDLIARAHESNTGIIDIDFPDEDKFKHLPARKISARAPSAFLTIQEGCDKFCTFCVVPYTRGVEYSRPVSEIIEEAERLGEAGVRELTLLGQNVNADHGSGEDGSACALARLLRRLAEIPEIERLRYTTSHPHDMSDDLIAVHGSEEKVMPYLHLPFQSGSDKILKAMNRKHTAAHYLELITRIRAARADIAMSTDIIVGFPGESDADFQKTLDVVAEVEFAQAYSFKYSGRPGTPAAAMENQVPEMVKSERLQALQAVLRAQQGAFNQSCVGRKFDVLFERTGRRPGQLVGRSPYLQAVHANGPISLIGAMIEVEILSAGPNSLEAEIVKSADSAIIAAE